MLEEEKDETEEYEFHENGNLRKYTKKTKVKRYRKPYNDKVVEIIIAIILELIVGVITWLFL